MYSSDSYDMSHMVISSLFKMYGMIQLTSAFAE